MSSINLITKLISCVAVGKVIAASPSLVPVTVTDTKDRKWLGKEKAYFTLKVLHQGKSRQELIETGAWRQELKKRSCRNSLTVLLPGSYSVTFIIEPRSMFQIIRPPTLFWVLLQQLPIQKVPNIHVQRPTGHKFSIESFSSQVC